MTKFKRRFKRVMSLGLAVVMSLSLWACGEDDPGTNPTNNGQQQGGTANTANIKYGLTEKIQDGTILQVWCWNFKTIKEHMADIAYAGFSTIQTVPINNCAGNDKYMELGGPGMWYNHYQPTDWKIGNYQVGTEDEFKEMCKVADQYGIKVIVDVVPNHVGGRVSDDLINAVGGEDKLFHANGKKTIKNYSDRVQATSYAMSGLADVDTENPLFQDYFISYLNKCVEDGADGFRFDTAKHIALPDDPKVSDQENNFWPRVTTETKDADRVFMYGEVLQGDNERLDAYAKMLDGVCASNYGRQVRDLVIGKKFYADRLLDMKVASGVDKQKLVTWVESHDNYLNDGSYKTLSNEGVALGWAFIASRSTGIPLFYNRPFGATKKNNYGTQNYVGPIGDNNWLHPVVIAANRFRNAMKGEAENIFAGNSASTVVVVERGSKGVSIINVGADDTEFEFTTALSAGSYKDRVYGENTYEVKDGKLKGTISKRSAIILYNTGYIEIPKNASAAIEGIGANVYDTDPEYTVTLDNVKSAYYTIDDSTQQVSVKSGDKVKLTGTIDAKSHISIYMTSNSGESFVNSFYYNYKASLKAGDSFNFIKPSNWTSDKIYAYIYTLDDEGNKKEVSAWPGELMTAAGGKTYTYQLKDTLREGRVIFNDGGDMKVPAKNDYLIEKDKNY